MAINFITLIIILSVGLLILIPIVIFLYWLWKVRRLKKKALKSLNKINDISERRYKDKNGSIQKESNIEGDTTPNRFYSSSIDDERKMEQRKADIDGSIRSKEHEREIRESNRIQVSKSSRIKSNSETIKFNRPTDI